jgi:hypothetical protein
VVILAVGVRTRVEYYIIIFLENKVRLCVCVCVCVCVRAGTGWCGVGIVQGDPKRFVPIFYLIKNPFLNEFLFCCRT